MVIDARRAHLPLRLGAPPLRDETADLYFRLG